jgi:cold shock CspA family protein
VVEVGEGLWSRSHPGHGTEPKGIWVSFSHIDGDGPRELFEGEIVEIEYKPAQQDSFRFSAVRVRRG